MNLKNFPKTLESKTSCLRIAVPENLDLALEGLIRKVLREQPKTDDIYSFAADYFETLLKIRDKTGAKFTSNQLCPFHNDENAHEMIKLATSFSKPSAKTKESPPLLKNKIPRKKKETEAKKNQRKSKLKDTVKTGKPNEKETSDLLRKLPVMTDKRPEMRSEIKKEEFLTSDPIKELVEKEIMKSDLLNNKEETVETPSGQVPESDSIQLAEHEATENDTEKLLQSKESITENYNIKTVEESNKIEDTDKKTVDVGKPENSEAENKSTAEENKDSFRKSAEEINRENNEKKEIKEEITDKEKPENSEAENKSTAQEKKNTYEESVEETNKQNNSTTEIKETANLGAENKTTAEKENKESNEKKEIKEKIADAEKPEETDVEDKTITEENKDFIRMSAEETNKESYEKTKTEKETSKVEEERKTLAEGNKNALQTSGEDANKENNAKTEINKESSDVEKPENVKAENKATVEENKNTLGKSAEEANKESNERKEIKEEVLDVEKPKNVEVENKTTEEKTVEDGNKRLEEASEHKTKNLEEENESIQKAEANSQDKTKLNDKEAKVQTVTMKTTTEVINEVSTTIENDKKTQMQPDENKIKETAEQPKTGETPTDIETKTSKATADISETKILSDQQQEALQAGENTTDPTESVTAEESKNSKSKPETVHVKEDNLLGDDKNCDTRNVQATEGIAGRADSETISPWEEPNESGKPNQVEDNLTDLTVRELIDATEDAVEDSDKSNDLNNNVEIQAVTQRMHDADSNGTNGGSVPEVKTNQEQEAGQLLTKSKNHFDTAENIAEEPCIVVDTQHIQNTDMQKPNLEGTQNTEDKAGQPPSVFDSQSITNTKSDLQKENKITQEELCTVIDVQHIPKEVQNSKDDNSEEQQTPTDAQSTTGSSSLQTGEAIKSPHIAIEEVEKGKEKPQSQGEVQIKTIQTHYYDTLQVPEVVTKEFRLHSVATEAMNISPNVPAPVDETKGESAEPPISLSTPEDDNHSEYLKNTSPSVDASSLQESTDDLLMTPTSGYSLDLSDLSWKTVTGLFLDSEKRYSSLRKPTENKQEVDEVFHKTVILSNIKAVPVPPRDADQLNEESNLQISTDKKEEKPENESSNGSSNNERSSDSDIPFISVEVKTVIETQILDDEDEKKDENGEEGVQPDVEVKVEATIDIIDERPEVVKQEMPYVESQEKNDPKPSLEEIQDESQQEERRESRSTEQPTGREGSSGESDSTLSSAPTEIRRTDSGKRNLSSARSLLSTQSLDHGKRNPLLKTRSLSTFRHGVTDFEVWTAIEKELEEAATKIQSKYRGYKTRKKLQRENAVEKTTEESPTSTTPVEAEDKDERQQSTGEFHDTIVLSEYPR